ncbi:hypothetical protein PG999_009920 [Apiospora kogelbergensis]|uniref:Uncharacterized protein n=1 Tax=Apiospora kogelbergensis TaxID=1337665 RepID=A0AAW0QTQ2_9PEZI
MSDYSDEDQLSGSEYGESSSESPSDHDEDIGDVNEAELVGSSDEDERIGDDEFDAEVFDEDNVHVGVQDSAAVAKIADLVQRCETELRDLSPDGEDEDNLFDGNVHPLEYYRQGMKDMVVDRYKRKVYAKGTEKQIQNSENQSRQQW